MDIFPTFSFFLTNLSSVFSTFMDKTPPKRSVFSTFMDKTPPKQIFKQKHHKQHCKIT